MTGVTTASTKQRRAALAAALIAVGGLAACTQRADEREIVIEHHALYPGVAMMMAENHCARFGKDARQVQAGNTQTTYLWLRGRVSIFECVERPTPPAGDGGATK